MQHITDHLVLIKKSFGSPRKAVDIERLRKMYAAHSNLAQLVNAIAKPIFTEGAPRVRVGRYKSGSRVDAPAWIVPPRTIPLYGSKDFLSARFTMGFQDQFVKEVPFETLVFAVAHELSHIILYSVRHALSKNEKAVDLTAMYFGYAEVYTVGKRWLTGHEYVTETLFTGRLGVLLSKVGLNPTLEVRQSMRQRIGYLTDSEMRHASSWIMRHRS
jgi:hypothetical protein